MFVKHSKIYMKNTKLAEITLKVSIFTYTSMMHTGIPNLYKQPDDLNGDHKSN